MYGEEYGIYRLVMTPLLNDRAWTLGSRLLVITIPIAARTVSYVERLVLVVQLGVALSPLKIRQCSFISHAVSLPLTRFMSLTGPGRLLIVVGALV